MPRITLRAFLAAIVLAVLGSCSSAPTKREAPPPPKPEAKLEKVRAIGVLRSKQGAPLAGKVIRIAPLLTESERPESLSIYPATEGFLNENVLAFKQEGAPYVGLYTRNGAVSLLPEGKSQADGQFAIEIDRALLELLQKFNKASAPAIGQKKPLYDLEQYAVVSHEGKKHRELRRGGQPIRIKIDWKSAEINLGEIVL